MKPGDDLAPQALAAVLGDREVQSHGMLLSTAVTATDWARAGAPGGSVVVADHQIAARGRAGRPWKVTPGQDLAFALVLRPPLESEREGWLYPVVLAALADTSGRDVTIGWPDEIQRDGVMAAAAGIEVKLGGLKVKWAVVNVLIRDAKVPRGAHLAAVLEAIDARLAAAPGDLLGDYLPLCRTVGRDVRVRLLGGSTRLQGRALDVLDSGALLLETDTGRQVPVRPQDIASIDDL